MSNVKIYQDKKIQVFLAEEREGKLNVGMQGITAFQLIIASSQDISVSDVKGIGVSCLSVEGVNEDGNAFQKEMPVEAGKPWSFWCLLDGKELMAHKGNQGVLPITITLSDGSTFTFALFFEVSEAYNHLTRLSWLNSKEGLEATVTQGFTPVAVDGRTIKILGREIRISKTGMLESIKSFFVGNNSTFSEEGREILASPVEYEVFENGKKLVFINESLDIIRESDAGCKWQAVNVSDGLKMTVFGKIDFDGSAKLCAKISEATPERELSVRLVHKPRPEFAQYFMGLGLQGQAFPKEYTWKWDFEKHQDSYWAGNVNGGLSICPVDEEEKHPFVNIYFRHGDRNQPETWVNGGRGLFRLQKDEKLQNETCVLYYESGNFCLDREKTFCAKLFITPFKKIDLKKRWNTHYYHRHTDKGYRQADVDDAVANGCNYMNLHHGNELYPYINYPMYDMEALRELIDMAHRKDLGIKLYYTIRELTTRLPELSAFLSLRDEIFAKPKNIKFRGIPWQKTIDPYITENFGDDVVPAWCHSFKEGKYAGTTDPSVITNPHSRLANFYVESIAYLIRELGIDGIYLDDVGYDSKVLRRVRRVFEKYHGSAEIDFHMWNHFEDDLGAGFGHNILMYMNLFPYVDSLWIGEGYDYSRNSADYLMTEVSGIPFGLTSEFLERDCNVWRGMLYGITGRYPYYQYYKGPNPVPVWKMRKPFEDAEMIGYWEAEKPVWADDPNVLCTTYFDREKNRMLCCFANFGDSDASFKLCGSELEGRRIYAPYIEGVQKEGHFSITDEFTVDKIGGIMLIIE